MDYFAGLHISMDETHVCVLDREGVVVRESKAASTAEGIADELSKAPSSSHRIRDRPHGAKLVNDLKLIRTKRAGATDAGLRYICAAYVQIGPSARSNRAAVTCRSWRRFLTFVYISRRRKAPMPSIVSHGRRASSSSLHLLPRWPDYRRSSSRIYADQAL
jgi:hypothetical protein